MAAELKQQGNQLYAEGKVEEAILKYKQGIETIVGKSANTTMLEKAGSGFTTDRTTVASTVASTVRTSTSSSENKVSAEAKETAILYSNASQALIDLKRFDAAAASAEAAVSYDPAMVKAWVRRVKATMAAGSRFEAFIHFYLNVAPLLKEGTKQDQAELMKIVGDLGDVVAEAVGVTGVHAALALRRTKHTSPKKADGAADTDATANAAAGSDDGGLSTVATQPIAAESVIFTEKQFVHAKLDAKAPNPTLNDLSSEELIKHFSEQLVATIRLKKEEATVLWTQFACVMRGSWPRNLNEISQPLATHFLSELRTHHKKDIEAGYIIDDTTEAEGNTTTDKTSPKANGKNFSVTLSELTHLAVACRYNCFHSGFFRTCALANHSCNPNAAMKYVAAQQKVVMVAVRDIAEGEDITVKYLPDLEYVMGVSRRRELLYKSWLFWCDCKRCETDLFDKDSKCEWVKCQSCKDPVKGYAHLPNRGLYLEKPDPSIPDSSKCFGCGAEVTMDKDATMVALKTVDTLFNRIREEQLTLVQMGDALMDAWRGAEPLVHEEHWTHRVQLYCYCLVLAEMIQSWFNFVASKQLQPEQTVEILYCYGLSEGRETSKTVHGGGDLLVAILELWRRIEAFYPPAQAWHLHLMVTKLICLNLLQPEATRQMDYDEAVEVLAKHTPFIGAQERAAHLRVLLQHKDADKEIMWTPKVLKAVKKAFA